MSVMGGHYQSACGGVQGVGGVLESGIRFRVW